MPHENERKPCTHRGSNGVMVYRRLAKPPGQTGSAAGPEADIVWTQQRPTGWVCDLSPTTLNPNHLQLGLSSDLIWKTASYAGEET
jgi:hypothetical protein